MSAPSQPPILTSELARRLETLVAPEPVDSQHTDDLGTPFVRRFGQTIAVKARIGRPISNVLCFSAQDLPWLDAILDFYAVDGLEPRFLLSPAGFSAEVAQALTKAGFAQTEYSQAILYGLPVADKPLPAADLTVERVTMETLDEFAQMTAEGFEWPATWRPGAMAGVRRAFRPSAHHFLARLEGKPAGVASLRLREGVATLCDSAVVPALRGRGVHSALIAHRRHLAHALGCELVMGGADFGSASFRNQERAGLRLAYVESGWSKR